MNFDPKVIAFKTLTGVSFCNNTYPKLIYTKFKFELPIAKRHETGH